MHGAFSFQHPEVSLKHIAMMHIGLTVLKLAKWVTNTVQLLNAHSVSACFDLYNPFARMYAHTQRFIEMSCQGKLPEAIFHNIDSTSHSHKRPKKNQELCISVVVDLSLKQFWITVWQYSLKNSRGVSTPKQHSLLAGQTDTDSHSHRLGNGEQTALLLNTLFMLLLPAEFSHNVTTWKESTSDKHRPCLSHLYNFFPCLSHGENSQANSVGWQAGGLC